MGGQDKSGKLIKHEHWSTAEQLAVIELRLSRRRIGPEERADGVVLLRLSSPQDRLSEAAELLTALLQHPDMAAEVKDRLSKVARNEITVIMDRLLDRARQEQEWGVPPILEACLVIADADPSQGSRLAAFLSDRPGTQIKPNIVPKIGDQPWAKQCSIWEGSAGGLSAPVKTAIKRRRDDGNVRV